MQIVCTLSDEQFPVVKGKIKRKVLPASKEHGDGKELYHDILPMDSLEEKPKRVSSCYMCRYLL